MASQQGLPQGWGLGDYLASNSYKEYLLWVTLLFISHQWDLAELGKHLAVVKDFDVVVKVYKYQVMYFF